MSADNAQAISQTIHSRFAQGFLSDPLLVLAFTADTQIIHYFDINDVYEEIIDVKNEIFLQL